MNGTKYAILHRWAFSTPHSHSSCAQIFASGFCFQKFLLTVVWLLLCGLCTVFWKIYLFDGCRILRQSLHLSMYAPFDVNFSCLCFVWFCTFRFFAVYVTFLKFFKLFSAWICCVMYLSLLLSTGVSFILTYNLLRFAFFIRVSICWGGGVIIIFLSNAFNCVDLVL